MCWNENFIGHVAFDESIVLSHVPLRLFLSFQLAEGELTSELFNDLLSNNKMDTWL